MTLLTPILWLLLFTGLLTAVGVYVVLMVLLAAPEAERRALRHSASHLRIGLDAAQLHPEAAGASPPRTSPHVIAFERRR